MPERSCLTSLQPIRDRAANASAARAFPVWPAKKRVLQRAVCHLALHIDIRVFKKLRPLLHRKRHIQLELCVRLSVLRLFHVGYVVQNRRRALSLAWHE